MSVGSLAITTVVWTRPTPAADGGAVTTASLGTLSCRVQPLSGAERKLYERETEVVTHKVYVPGSPGVKSSDRLTLDDGSVLLVRAVRDIDRLGRFLTIEAEVQL